MKAPLVDRAREAFAAYSGLGKDIIDELIFALEVANREVERLAGMTQQDGVPPIYTSDEKGKCAAREWEMRLKVYPRLVEQGRMTKEMAARETALMAEIADDYMELARMGSP